MPGEVDVPHPALADAVEQDVRADEQPRAVPAEQPPALERGQPAAADQVGRQAGLVRLGRPEGVEFGRAGRQQELEQGRCGDQGTSSGREEERVRARRSVGGLKLR
ncbi:MAG: hypothetical protein K2V38_00420 [Gemmataceae bacterium]|nr:hypothetical protein [Gemmataceae bacterium]